MTSCEILVTSAKFLVPLPTRRAQFRTLSINQCQFRFIGNASRYIHMGYVIPFYCYSIQVSLNNPSTVKLEKPQPRPTTYCKYKWHSPFDCSECFGMTKTSAIIVISRNPAKIFPALDFHLLVKLTLIRKSL